MAARLSREIDPIEKSNQEYKEKYEKILAEILDDKIEDENLKKFKTKTDEWTAQTTVSENDSFFDKDTGSYFLTLEDTDEYLSFLEDIFSGVPDSSIMVSANWSLSKDNKPSNFSTGEFFLLELFTRIYAIKETLSENNKSFLFLFDEVDLGYHPAWQRRIISILIESLPKIFNNCNIQIIVTSHSPFIISDLPNENVIFLTKDEKKGNCIVKNSLNDMKQTFGANIHTLLSDSFFMDSLMGDFAKSKIDGVIKFLKEGINPVVKTQKDVEKIINMIGEPVIKRYLRKELANKRVDEIENKIQNLQNQIDELKILKNRQNDTN